MRVVTADPGPDQDATVRFCGSLVGSHSLRKRSANSSRLITAIVEPAKIGVHKPWFPNDQTWDPTKAPVVPLPRDEVKALIVNLSLNAAIRSVSVLMLCYEHR